METSAHHESPEAARREAALARLIGRLDYERTAMPHGGAGLKLDRMRALLARLGDPQNRLPIVHVAGTKGKGSTSAMIAAALSAAGLRTGLFTSPHLEMIEQRFAVDGAACSAEELINLVEQVWPAVTAIDNRAPAGQGPTFFEITTAMAHLHFIQRGVDAIVLEVGMGGRLDSTNVCTPQLSVITCISFDHTKQLGDTLAKIAREKAGILKPGVPAVSGVIIDEPREVIRRVAAQRDCRLVELGREFDYVYHPAACEVAGAIDFQMPGDADQTLAGVQLNLLGRHQGFNAAVALAAIAELRRAGWQLPEAAVRQGFAQCTLPARVEIVGRQPTVVIDAAHNVASVEALVATLQESFAPRRRTLILASTRDKDLRGMLQVLLPHFERIVLTRYKNNPRAVPTEELELLVRELSDVAPQVFDDPAAAWEHVRGAIQPDELVCVAGSFFIAAELRPLIAARPIDVTQATARGVA